MRVKLKDGWLVAADGRKVARIVAIEIELLDPPAEEPAAELELADEPAVDEAALVWARYVEVMRPRNVSLDSQARTVIRDALKVATLDECRRAIDGCKASEFHMGVNDRRKKYNRVTHILKGKRGQRTTREQIDLFLDIAEKRGLSAGMTSGDPARINGAKRDVLAAHEYPNDEHTARRGVEAREWLLSQGWTIGVNETGWPTFRPPQ